MISDVKLKLILDLYKNDKLTLEEVKILLQEEKEQKFTTDPFQVINPWPYTIPITGSIPLWPPYTTSVTQEEVESIFSVPEYIPTDEPSLLLDADFIGNLKGVMEFVDNDFLIVEEKYKENFLKEIIGQA